MYLQLWKCTAFLWGVTKDLNGYSPVVSQEMNDTNFHFTKIIAKA